ncbi:MAG TPA: tetratricopeptide repeat protein [Longimicrobiales bacterium]
MNRTTGLILALFLGVAAGACASGGAGGSAADGFEPKDNDHTREAEQNIALAMLRSSDADKQQLYQQALESAKLAIQEDSTNPQGWFLAGQAHANLGAFDSADAAWDKAVALYPGFEEQIDRERENAWVRAYNEGVGAIQQDDLDAAIAQMEKADAIFQGRPEARLQLGVFYARKNEVDKAISAYRGALEILRSTPKMQLDSATQADWAANEEIALSNLAQLLSSSGRDAEAEALFREVLAEDPTNIRARVNLADVLARQGKTAEADQIYAELIDRDDLTYNHYLNMGVGLFQAEKYEQSANAFRKAVQVNPYSRDGYYNLAQALFMRADALEDEREAAKGAAADSLAAELAEIHTELASSAEKVLELDPSNRNIIAYMARAYQALSELTSDEAAKEQYREKIRAALKRHEEAQFEVMDVSLLPGDDEVTMSGRIMNLKVAEGAPIRLRIELRDAKGAVIGTQDVTVTAPAANATAEFRVSVPVTGELAGWSYKQIQ